MPHLPSLEIHLKHLDSSLSTINALGNDRFATVVWHQFVSGAWVGKLTMGTVLLGVTGLVFAVDQARRRDSEAVLVFLVEPK